VGDLVLTFAGGAGDKGLLAYNIENGELVWSMATGPNSYSSPQLATIDGVQQVLMITGDELTGADPATGKAIWTHALPGGMFIPINQPQPVGDGQLLIPMAKGLALVHVARQEGKWAVEQSWASIALRPSLNDCVIHDNLIYGFDDGIFCCVDLQTGKRRWKAGRYRHGQVLLLPDVPVLLVISEEGEAILVATNPDRLQELGRFQALHGKTWNHPIVAHGALFVRNGEEMACYQLEMTHSQRSETEPRP